MSISPPWHCIRQVRVGGTDGGAGERKLNGRLNLLDLGLDFLRQVFHSALRNDFGEVVRDIKRRGIIPQLPLSAEQQVQFKARLAAGPTAKDEVCTLRGEDLQRILEQEFGVLRKLSSIYYLLHSLGYSSLVPRPRHVKADPGRQELFKKVDCPTNSLPSVERTRTNKSKFSSRTKLGSDNKGR